MTRFGKVVRALAVALVFALAASAPVAKAEYIDISARAAVVMDADTGQVIIAKNMDRQLPPASTTKVMTAILALDSSKMDDWFTVSARAASVEPTKINLKRGDMVTVEALLYSLMMKSANDSATVIAENIAGSEKEFAKLMTERARELGAVNTTFKTASGLPADGQLTTAYDLALLMRHAMGKPGFQDIVSTRYATLHMGGKRDLKLKNSNKLLWQYEGAIGGKTGYTRRARECYVGEVDCGGRRLIVSVLGSEVRWQDVRTLLDKGFELASRGESLRFETAEVKHAVKKTSRHRKTRKTSGRSKKKSSKGSI